jgi:hypothetical protein
MSGFFHKPDPTAYTFGSGQLFGTILQADGQWDAYLPEIEDQTENDYDPYSCASEGTTNCIEILLKHQYGL